MLCAIIKGPSQAQIEVQLTKARSLVNLVELRLDLFDEWSFDYLKSLQQAFALDMIFTLRSQAQGGRFKGSTKQQLALLVELAALQPTYLDVEYPVSKAVIKKLTGSFPDVKLILSHHNLIETPLDLNELAQKMQQIPAYFYKIAVMALSTLDALHLINWHLSTCASPFKNRMIMISLGLEGQVTRILAPIIGSPLTYGTVEEEELLSGMLSITQLKQCYRHEQLTSKTAVFGLIGDPITGSISQETHNALFQTLALDAVYIKMRIQCDELEQFFTLVKSLPLAIKGLSVTMPLKEAVLAYVDEIEAASLPIQAINTLHFEDRKIKGYNTDSWGALNVMEKHGAVKDKQLLLIGAGGVAKAIAHEAVKRGAHVTIANRDFKKAELLANLIKGVARQLELLKAFDPYQILVNCTPSEQPCPLDALSADHLLMETKTKPKLTAFLKEGRQKGCELIFGYQLFVEQAVGQFAIWFNQTLSPSLVREILSDRALKCLKCPSL